MTTDNLNIDTEVENLSKMIESSPPEIQEKIRTKLGLSNQQQQQQQQALNTPTQPPQPPIPPTSNQPPIPPTSTEQPEIRTYYNVDFKGATPYEFVKYEAKNDTDVVAQLMQRHPDISAADVEDLCSNVKSMVTKKYQMLNRFPENPYAEIKAMSEVLMEAYYTKQSERENSKVELAAQHRITLSKEFGENHVNTVKPQLDAHIAKVLHIPLDEVRSMAPDRYAAFAREFRAHGSNFDSVQMSRETDKEEEIRKRFLEAAQKSKGFF
jgi:hypothetical protein